MSIASKYQQKKANWNQIVSVLKHSITKKLLVVVFSIYFILTVSVTLVQMAYEYQFSKTQAVTALQNIQSMSADSISQAIWEFNTPQIDSILEGIYTNKSLVGLKLQIIENSSIPELTHNELGLINNEQGELIFVDPKTKEAKLKNDTLERLIPYIFEIYHTDSNNNKQVIGKLSLYSSNKIVFNQVKESYLLLIINAMIKTVALWVFFLWAGYNYISKPLAQLNKAIETLSSGNWKTEIKYDDNSKNKNEIHSLIDSFNNMTHKLFNTQNKLETSRNRLNNIFDTMPSALIFIDNKHIIQGWNKYISEETNIEASSAINRELTSVYPAFKDYLYLISDAISANKEQQVKNAKLINKAEDSNRLFNIVVYPMLFEKIAEAVIRIDDVTEQVKNEADLAQVEKLASVGALIAGVAHEINNPLGSIMQGTQNVLRRIDPTLEANQQAAQELSIDLTKQRQYLEKREIIKFLDGIREAGERASSIVKNMLKFTRRSTIDMIKYNIVDLINDGLQLASTDFSLQERTDFKKIKVVKQLCANDIQIECCPMEIQQVILNLLKNAAQALENKAGEKQISITLDLEGATKIKITISDNGSGIPADIQSKIFQPFFTTKPIGQGTGLGLSVCRNIIVQKHHGTMDVESNENVGTKFTIILPTSQT